jgi:hypothetical protein
MGRPALLVVTTAVAAVVAAAPASAVAMSKAQAVALANQVNLVTGDLPGFDVTPPDASAGAGNDSFAKCAGSVPEKRAIADISSADFSQVTDTSFDQVNSDIEVLPSARLVRKDIKASTTPLARRCLAKQVKREGLGGARVTSVRITTFPTGMPHSFAYRIRLLVLNGDLLTRVWTDALVTYEGPVEAGMITATSPNAPSQSEDLRLLGILSTRLDAALNPNALP